MFIDMRYCALSLSTSAKQPSSMKNKRFLLTPTVKRCLWEREQKEHGTTHLAPFEAVTLLLSLSTQPTEQHRERQSQICYRPFHYLKNIMRALGTGATTGQQPSYTTQHTFILSRLSWVDPSVNQTLYPGRGGAELCRTPVLYPSALFLTDV